MPWKLEPRATTPYLVGASQITASLVESRLAHERSLGDDSVPGDLPQLLRSRRSGIHDDAAVYVQADDGLDSSPAGDARWNAVGEKAW